MNSRILLRAPHKKHLKANKLFSNIFFVKHAYCKISKKVKKYESCTFRRKKNWKVEKINKSFFFITNKQLHLT